MLANVQLTALIIAAVLILVGGAYELRAEIVQARRTHAGTLEWIWISLPVLFLVLLVWLSGARGVW